MQKGKKENVKSQVGIKFRLTDKLLCDSSICNIRVQLLHLHLFLGLKTPMLQIIAAGVVH